MFPEGRAVEFLVAAIVALIVVGPKDLPILLRKLGQFMAKVRSMAAEFRASFDEMARQSELDELRKEVEAMRKGQLLDIATHAPEVTQTFDEISQGLSDVGVQLNAPVSYPYGGAQTSDVEVAPVPKVRRRKAPAKAKAGAKAKGGAKSPAKASAAKKAPAPKTVAKAKSAAKIPPAKAPAKAAPARPRPRKAAAS
ncbi:MAG: Sec-independent protein translocase protein TatB [Caulobacterales bacterium]|jgi:sec-independent protein translocase protein TatB